MHDPTTACPSALSIARYVEAQLHSCLPDAVPDPFHLDARIYGLTIHDPAGVLDDRPGALRQTCLGEARSVYDLLDGAAGIMARLYDAAAVLTTGWAAPLPPSARGDWVDEADRPSRHPERRRIRLLVVVDDGGVGSVLRFADDPEHVIVEPGGSGALADALDELWSGRIGVQPVPPPGVRGCARRS
jgi:hypothetical protein